MVFDCHVLHFASVIDNATWVIKERVIAILLKVSLKLLLFFPLCVLVDLKCMVSTENKKNLCIINYFQQLLKCCLVIKEYQKLFKHFYCETLKVKSSTEIKRKSATIQHSSEHRFTIYSLFACGWKQI